MITIHKTGISFNCGAVPLNDCYKIVKLLTVNEFRYTIRQDSFQECSYFVGVDFI